MFFIFLGLSILFWTLTKLSKEYKHTVIFNAKYINFTNDKVLQKPPTKQVKVLLNTSGFSLLKYNLNTSSLKIDLSNLQKKEKQFFYLPNRNLTKLQTQLSLDETILNIEPDTLFFDFGNLKLKKIVVIPNLEINYEPGFSLVKKRIVPDSVLITGPEKLIEKIISVTTKKAIFNKVSSNINKNITLEIPSNLSKVHFSLDKVKLNVQVEKFTEGSLQVPFQIINTPDSLKISTFSKKIKLTYKVSLNNYDKVQLADFKVICDYNKTKKDQLDYLVPKIVKKSALITNVRMAPNKIEFLSKK